MAAAHTYRNRALWLIAALLIIRGAALGLSPYGLHGDEAQYWAWSQDLDWGYFSKPPMIAWLIALTTSIFGHTEWAVRLASPVLHSAAGFFIFLTGRKIFSPQAGFWACAIYMLMPAIWLSSMIISTDAALLFFWSLGLHGWASLRAKASWRYAVQLGLALGLGVLSKYAMLFFIPPLILAIFYDAPSRKALLSLKGGVASIIAAIIIAPNIWWNSAHNFATLSHTAANTNLENKTRFFHPIELAQFLRDQFGVFGPIPFIMLLIALFGLKHLYSNTSKNTQNNLAQTVENQEIKQNYIILAAFTLTPLILISVQALLSRANANWAVSAYPSAALLLAAFALHLSPVKIKRKAWLNRGLFMQSLFCSFLLAVSLHPNIVDQLGVANSVKRLRAWPETVSAITAKFEAGHETKSFQSIVLDNRRLFYDVQYYGLGKAAPLYIWQKDTQPQSHAYLTHPFTKAVSPNENRPVLLINYTFDNLENFEADFTRLEPLAPIEIDLGGSKMRVLKAWAAYGYRPKS